MSITERLKPLDISGTERDKDVVNYGKHKLEELRKPHPRKDLPPQEDREAIKSLKKSALNRALYFGFGVGEIPHVLFPNGEHFQAIPFANEHWEEYGNLEAERNRINFMLDNYPSRAFPVEFNGVVDEAVTLPNVLKTWKQRSPEITQARIDVFNRIQEKMDNQKVKDDFGYKNGDRGANQSDPIFYEVSEDSVSGEKILWKRALDQITDELINGNYNNLAAFIDLYNHIKDPITPITAVTEKQVEVFTALFEQTRQSLSENGPYSADQYKTFIVQLALESSFFASPAAENVVFTRYSDHHELPYIYVDIKDLPRGEFASPVRTIEIAESLINETRAQATPIAVSQYQVPGESDPGLFIVDGNNRATAILLMKFIDYVGFDKEKILNYQESLSNFMKEYNLDIKWERDISVTLSLMAFIDSLDFENDYADFDKKASEFMNKHGLDESTWKESLEKLFAATTRKPIDYLLDNQEVVNQYAHSQMPALLVQEHSFHTIACSLSQQEEIVLLQPMHQAIYNKKDSSIAIPSKKQTHGRSKGNSFVIPLRTAA